ncbi:MAG: peptidoglycan DD-metalloendopeptidase family protein [Anaerolineae bacterium]
MKRRRVGLWAGILLAALVLVWPGTVHAGGLVISAGPFGEGGPQVDAAQLSPAPRVGAGQAVQPRTYVVQRGDTLSSIAARFGVSAATLMAQNGLANADRINAGMVLQVGAEARPLPDLPPDGELVRVQFWPWPPAQGQTLAVWLRTRSAIGPTVRFGASDVSVMSRGRQHWAAVPIEALAPAGVRPLTVTVGSATWVFPVAIREGVFEMQEIPAEAADPILSQTEKVNAEWTRLAALFAERHPGDWTPRSRFVTPLPADATYEHSSPFGSRRTYGGASGLSAHAGEDYAAAPGTPVLAPAAGRVVLAEPLFVRGNAVILDHGNGVFTGYWHLASLAVRAGERVDVGQVLGTVGNTGLSTGPHLHWELRIGGIAVDPLQWVEGGN